MAIFEQDADNVTLDGWLSLRRAPEQQHADELAATKVAAHDEWIESLNKSS